MPASPTTISYERAHDVFRITSGRGERTVRESAIRAIGDMDLSDLMERAKNNPYVAFTVRRAFA